MMEAMETASASPATTRRSYTAEFKLRVVRELAPPGAHPPGASAPAGEVRALAARHGLTPSMVRRWVSRRAELEAAVLERRALAGGSAAAPLRKLGSGRRPAHRELDAALAAWVRRQRALGVDVKDRDMQAQARALAAAQGLQGFRASKGYVFNFKQRHALGGEPAAARPARVARTAPAEAAAPKAGACLFGMDIGTTAVKCAVVSAATGAVLATSSAVIEPPGDRQTRGSSEGSGQASGKKDGEKELDAAAVLLAARSAIQQLPVPLRAGIASVGVCGRVRHAARW